MIKNITIQYHKIYQLIPPSIRESGYIKCLHFSNIYLWLSIALIFIIIFLCFSCLDLINGIKLYSDILTDLQDSIRINMRSLRKICYVYQDYIEKAAIEYEEQLAVAEKDYKNIEGEFGRGALAALICVSLFVIVLYKLIYDPLE